MTLTELLILGIAVWRIAYMVTRESGPLGMFSRLRDRLENKHEPAEIDGRLAMHVDYRPFNDLVTCTYCLSVWLAIPAALYTQPETLADGIIHWLAIAGVAAVIQRWAGFDYRSVS